MWATKLDIETFTEYYHSLKVCTDINLNLVSKFLLPQISIIVNDIFNISYLNNVSYFKNRWTYMAHLVLKITRNPKFLFNFCIKKGMNSIVFKLLQKCEIAHSTPFISKKIYWSSITWKILILDLLFLHKLNINLGFPVILSTKWAM